MSARTDVEAELKQSETGVTPDTLKASLEKGVGAVFVEVRDLSGMFSLSFSFPRLPSPSFPPLVHPTRLYWYLSGPTKL